MPLINTQLLRMSQLYAPTLKEDPMDAEIASHRFLTRGAFMRKVAAGVYSFLPLGWRVLRKLEQIVREEQDAIGSQEMIMSIIQPAELWHESGRWNVYGPELMRFEDRHGHGFALSPTQEELITALVRSELRSYKELPKSLYHIQWKYRDEIRPRFGLLRGREFVMKDAYSFHASQESLQEHYDEQAVAYGRICNRLGLVWRAVEADSGQIGGKVTTEFMALAEAGEAELVYCGCGFAANTEVAEAELAVEAYAAPPAALDSGIKLDSGTALGKAAALDSGIAPNEGTAPTLIHTPQASTIAHLAAFLHCDESATVKALAGKDAAGVVHVLFIPGNHELGLLKALKAVPGFELLTDEELQAAGLVKGYMGPVGLPPGVRVVADTALQKLEGWLVGANRTEYHLAGARPHAHFTVDLWASLAVAKAGDRCPQCGGLLELARGIEVGQVFQLGTKYSEAMGASYMSASGAELPFLMGCYGWGVTRSLAAVVEQHNDEQGICWPVSVAPAEVAVLPLAVGDELVAPAAEKLAAALTEAGIEVVIDDRDERAGVKFADADLIGWPFQIIVGKRGLESGVVELKTRAGGLKQELALGEAAAAVAKLVCAERTRYC